MKEFIRIILLRGIQVEQIVVCKTKKRAAELMRTSLYELNNFTNQREPITAQCIENPETVFIRFKRGVNQLTMYQKFNAGRVLSVSDAIQYIKEFRELYPTHREINEAARNHEIKTHANHIIRDKELICIANRCHRGARRTKNAAKCSGCKFSNSILL